MSAEQKHTPGLPPAIHDAFNVEERPHGLPWSLYCKQCGAGWSLKKPAHGASVSPGNILALLNHAASHSAKAEGRS